MQGVNFWTFGWKYLEFILVDFFHWKLEIGLEHTKKKKKSLRKDKDVRVTMLYEASARWMRHE